MAAKLRHKQFIWAPGSYLRKSVTVAATTQTSNVGTESFATADSFWKKETNENADNNT